MSKFERNSETKLRTLACGALRFGTLCGVLVVSMMCLGTSCPWNPPGPTACTVDADCDDSNGCTTDTCVIAADATEGECDSVAACEDDLCVDDACVECLDDAGCDNADVCDGSETCVAGACTDGTALDCDDADLCTDDACDATDGCSNTAVACADGETCVDGGCVLVCAADADCDDSDLCTTDTCVDTACSNVAVDCNDDVACTDDSCDGTTGACLNADNCAAGTECDAATGTCVTAVCTVDADCDNGTFCDGTETCDVATGSCVDGTRPCNDADGVGCTDATATESCAEGDAAAVCTACPSVTLDFTLGQDNLTGTSGDDDFLAALEFNTGSGTQIATIQTGDSANGLAGTDTLTASVNGTAAVPTLAGIETIDVTAFAATTITGTNISGVDEINSLNSTATLTITSMQEAANVGLAGTSDGASGLSITFATAVTAGSADAITTTLTGANAGTVTITTGATNGFETLNVTGTGSTANTLTAITQGTGTTMVTANLAGDQATQLKAMPSTIRTYTGSTMTGALTLGSGTRADATDTYASFATVDIAKVTGGTGNDVFIFGTSLDSSDSDQSGESIDGGAGTDVLQATFGSALGSALPIANIEELRVNASASSSSFSLLNVSGVSTVTVESDDTANTMTVDNVPVTSTAQTWPTLAFRGDGTQAAQTYDTITFNGFGASASAGDSMAVNFANRGTPLNSSGTTNAHTVTSMTVGSSSSTGMETLTITAADGPLSVTSTTTCFSCTGITVTGSSNVGLGTMTGTADSVTSLTATGVTGNFTGTIDNMNGGTIQLGTGNDTVDTTGSAASAMTIQGGAGNDTLTGAGGADTIQGAAGTDTLIGAAGADTLAGGDDNDTIQGDGSSDTITTGNGADTVVLTTVAADAANADTVSDFTAGSGGDQLEMDISALETSGATDANEAVNFVELQDGSAVVDTDSVVIQELTLDAAAGAVATVANTNVFVVIGTVASTSVLETALEAGGDVELTIAAAGGDITSCFPVVYSNATDAFLAICFAETEGVDDTNFEAADLVCINIAKMSSNAAITASEFVAANFDFVP